MRLRYPLAVGLLLLAAACSKTPEDIAPENSDLSEDQQIEEGAQTLEEAADKAMQIEIDSLNNVAPQTDDDSEKEPDGEDNQSEDKDDKEAGDTE